MPARVAIVAALPREIAGLVDGVPADPALKRRGIHLHRLPHGIVVAAGMGAARVAFAVEAALAAAPIAVLISAGLAGACTQELAAGAVAEASTVVDAKTGERYAAKDAGGLVLVTTDGIANVREKARLARSYVAAMVDMEAATVARLALANGLAFRAIKAVSDAHDFEIASMAHFVGTDGQFRTAAFAMHLAFRPKEWSKAMQLGRDSKRALVGLHKALREAMQEIHGAPADNFDPLRAATEIFELAVSAEETSQTTSDSSN